MTPEGHRQRKAKSKFVLHKSLLLSIQSTNEGLHDMLTKKYIVHVVEMGHSIHHFSDHQSCGTVLGQDIDTV
jgi:hypothetical protein